MDEIGTIVKSSSTRTNKYVKLLVNILGLLPINIVIVQCVRDFCTSSFYKSEVFLFNYNVISWRRNMIFYP